MPLPTTVLIVPAAMPASAIATISPTLKSGWRSRRRGADAGAMARAPSRVTAVDVEKAIRTRRTHKAFGPDAVDADAARELLELARWAPNHHLTNPWRFRVLGPRTRAALMELAESEKPGAAVKLRRAPTLVAVERAAGRRRRRRIARTCSPARVAAYIVLLGAHARGLAAYWRTVPLLDDPPRPRAARHRAPTRLAVGLLYLGDPVQEQRVPERAAARAIVIELD